MNAPRRRPGDRVVRVEPSRPREFVVRTRQRLRPPISPPAALIIGFAGMIALGTILLALPVSARSGEWTPPLDALFTATSAVCVTGLVVVDTATHWSGFGQVVILLLIQAGGFGIMTGSTLLLAIVTGRRTSLTDRLRVNESLGNLELGSVTRIVRRVAIFTLAVEGAGAVVLAIAFTLGGEAGGRGDPLGIWWGIFHAVSAFNNAGFDLTGDFRSLIPFVDDWIVLGSIGALVLVGGLGYGILANASAARRWRRMALETRLVLVTTLALLVGGTVFIGATEWSNPETLGSLPQDQRVLNAFFESTVLRTAGFTALPTAALLDETLFIVMALMFIGGASGSTAGGIKVNTFSVLLMAIASSVRGLPSAVAFGRRIPHAVVYRAISVALLALAVVFVVSLGLALTTDASFVDSLFEAVSAFGTVGATTGITTELNAPARLLVIATMFAGRLGPLTLVLALAARARPVTYRPAVDTVRIG